MTAKELIDLFDSKNGTRVLPIFNYVSEHYPTFNHPEIDLGDELFKALTELEALKRYPTSDEVCKALGKLFGTEFRFIKNRFCFIHEGPTAHVLDSGVRVITIDMLIEKAPHLITLIGRFYEGMEKGEGK